MVGLRIVLADGNRNLRWGSAKEVSHGRAKEVRSWRSYASAWYAFGVLPQYCRNGGMFHGGIDGPYQCLPCYDAVTFSYVFLLLVLSCSFSRTSQTSSTATLSLLRSPAPIFLPFWPERPVTWDNEWLLAWGCGDYRKVKWMSLHSILGCMVRLVYSWYLWEVYQLIALSFYYFEKNIKDLNQGQQTQGNLRRPILPA